MKGPKEAEKMTLYHIVRTSDGAVYGTDRHGVCDFGTGRPVRMSREVADLWMCGVTWAHLEEVK